MDGRLPESNLKRDLLLYTPRQRRSIIDGLHDVRSSGRALGMDEVRLKSYEEMFPNANRLKSGRF